MEQQQLAERIMTPPAGVAMSEHRIQNEIRNALAGLCLMFRANTGTAWTGNDITRLPNGSVLIRDARPFSTGLPPGFSDLFGLVPVVITPEMVGQTVGVFTVAEVKDENGRLSERQKAFLDAVKRRGGRAGVVRSVADALALVRGSST